MNLFEVNRRTCNQDGICIEICTSGIIELKEDRYPSPIPDADELCIRCGHCVAACPTSSLNHREMAVDQCPVILADAHLTVDLYEHFLRVAVEPIRGLYFVHTASFKRKAGEVAHGFSSPVIHLYSSGPGG